MIERFISWLLGGPPETTYCETKRRLRELRAKKTEEKPIPKDLSAEEDPC